MSCQSIPSNGVCDISLIARRYMSLPIYTQFTTLDGLKYKFSCDSVDAIDKYLMSECEADIYQNELQFLLEFIAFEDGELNTDPLMQLDLLLTEMVTSGKTCNIIQGAICNG